MAMSHMERGFSAATNKPVDHLACAPLASGVCRRLLPYKATYKEWASDPKIGAEATILGFQKYRMDFVTNFIDLSVTAADLGAHVRMDSENTPFVDEHIVHSMEDYEMIECPDVTKGRTGNVIELNRLVTEKLKGQVVLGGFLEGPLLTLSQSAGAERLFMDMFTDPAPIHKAMEQTTQMCCDAVEKIGETGVESMSWDFLWGNYAVLGDAEYGEFEGDVYAKKVLEATRGAGLSPGIHNCSDLPHLETQIRKFGVDNYSMAYYPLIEGSPTATQVIEQGYADKCLILGNLDPQIFVRSTAEQVTEATRNLCQEVKTALCKRGLNSTYAISTGCEIPPGMETRMENIDAMVEAVEKYAVMQ